MLWWLWRLLFDGSGIPPTDPPSREFTADFLTPREFVADVLFSRPFTAEM